jgi:hypothetical protein
MTLLLVTVVRCGYPKRRKRMKKRRDGLPGEPFTVVEDGAFLVVYKPPRMHSSPLKRNAAPGYASQDKTLLEWCARAYPEITAVRGRGAGEGGLLHCQQAMTSRGAIIFPVQI